MRGVLFRCSFKLDTFLNHVCVENRHTFLSHRDCVIARRIQTNTWSSSFFVMRLEKTRLDLLSDLPYQGQTDPKHNVVFVTVTFRRV